MYFDIRAFTSIENYNIIQKLYFSWLDKQIYDKVSEIADGLELKIDQQFKTTQFK